MAFKSGFVNIIGNPNVGKSTLMNALVGEKLSIITPKVQTTRHRILGIVTNEDLQIIFSDTPGIVKPHYELHHSMMNYVINALEDADILLYLTQPKDEPAQEAILEKIKESNLPLIIIINKIDLSTQDEVEQTMAQWKKIFPHSEIIPISALLKFNLESLMNRILEKLPENPPYYEKDRLTDKTERFFVSEIIREKIFKLYHREVPYSTEVVVERFKEEENIVRIMAYIFVARESQKIILIGKQGKAIKQLGTEARKDIEEFIGKKVFLELSVKVRKDWRNDPKQLKRLGYGE